MGLNGEKSIIQNSNPKQGLPAGGINTHMQLMQHFLNMPFKNKHQFIIFQNEQ